MAVANIIINRVNYFSITNVDGPAADQFGQDSAERIKLRFSVILLASFPYRGVISVEGYSMCHSILVKKTLVKNTTGGRHKTYTDNYVHEGQAPSSIPSGWRGRQ